jgi:hypothetical protein
VTDWRRRDTPHGEHTSASFDQALAAVLDVVGELVTVRVRDHERRTYVEMFGRLIHVPLDGEDPLLCVGEFFYLRLRPDAFTGARWGFDDYGGMWGITLNFDGFSIAIDDNLNRIGE